MLSKFKQVVLLSLVLLSGCANIRVGSVETVDLHLNSSWNVSSYKQDSQTKMVTHVRFEQYNKDQKGYNTIEVDAYDKTDSMESEFKKLYESMDQPPCKPRSAWPREPWVAFKSENGFLIEEFEASCPEKHEAFDIYLVSHDAYVLVRVIDGKSQRFKIKYSHLGIAYGLMQRDYWRKQLTDLKVTAK